MNGAHDLGGQQSLGPINPESESSESVFYHNWEKKVFAITLACGFLGKWNIDEARHSRERQHPVIYLSNSYYENWLAGLEKLLLEKKLISQSELTTGKSLDINKKSIAPNPHKAMTILSAGSPSNSEESKPYKFNIGDIVRVRNNHPAGHTRAPQYVRGCLGSIIRKHGVHTFPDDNAKGIKSGENLYTVRFDSNTLWGQDKHELTNIHIDLWEPYLSIE